MDITLDKNTGTEASIKIKLKEADYQKKFEEKLKEYSKKANIKGFRQGKVPTGVIKRMYGKAILAEEINELLVNSLRDYIKDNDIKIIGDPLPADENREIDWDNQKEFDFEYNVGLVDEFNYNLDFKLNKYIVKLSDKEVKELIDNLRKQYGNVTNPEQSDEGDSLYGLVEQESSEFSKESVLDIEKIGKKYKKKFIGLKKEDVVTFDVKSLFKEEFDLEVFVNKSKEELKDIKGDFTFKVININRTDPAELNQEFFDKIFGKDQVKSEEEFTNKYKEIVEENINRESDYFLQTEIQKKLTESTKMDIPKDFYKQWLLKTQENITEDALENDLDRYIQDLKWMLITNKIAEDYEIKVEHEDVMEQTKTLFREQFGPGMGEELEKNLDVLANNYLNQNNGENYYNVYNQVRTSKIMDKIKENIKITEKEVSKEEFEKKIKN